MTLTVKKIERLRKVPGRYRDDSQDGVRGLYLQVGERGASWVLRYERDGRERMMGLGPLALFGLKEARERAREQRRLLADGVDPLQRKRAQRAATAIETAKSVSFAECAKRYYDGHAAGWRSARHAAAWIGSLEKHVFPIFGRLPVADIDRTLVLKALEPLWAASPETGSRVRGRIEAVLGWATVRGYREGSNPATWKGLLDKALPSPRKVAKPEHFAAMPYSEVPDFVRELRRREGSAARALEFLILTAARSSEVLGMRWSEVDVAARMWVVPADRMKGGRQHRVPLSDRAVEVLRIALREEGNEHVFIGARKGNGLGSRALLDVLEDMGLAGTTTIHGFRSCFRDWCRERTSVPDHLAEMALAHVVGSETERAYARSDLIERRRDLAAAWARFVDGQPADVVPLRRAGENAKL